MKNKNYVSGTFHHLGTDEYYKRLSELSEGCTPIDCLCFEGRYFSGNITQTIKQYLLENPSKSFYVWLIDNGIEVTQG